MTAGADPAARRRHRCSASWCRRSGCCRRCARSASGGGGACDFRELRPARAGPARRLDVLLRRGQPARPGRAVQPAQPAPATGDARRPADLQQRLPAVDDGARHRRRLDHHRADAADERRRGRRPVRRPRRTTSRGAPGLVAWCSPRSPSATWCSARPIAVDAVPVRRLHRRARRSTPARCSLVGRRSALVPFAISQLFNLRLLRAAGHPDAGAGQHPGGRAAGRRAARRCSRSSPRSTVAAGLMVGNAVSYVVAAVLFAVAAAPPDRPAGRGPDPHDVRQGAGGGPGRGGAVGLLVLPGAARRRLHRPGHRDRAAGGRRGGASASPTSVWRCAADPRDQRCRGLVRRRLR